jgi:hydroxyethylthiazole kinase-like uncharacterized protein yjeF
MPRLITNALIHDMLPSRNRKAYKGSFGRVLLIAGSEGMMGAAVLSARGALRSGAGLVSVACRKEFFPVVHAAVPEATCLDQSFCSMELQKYDAIGIGPGLGLGEHTAALLKTVLSGYDGPVILDADALNTLAMYKIQFKSLTSHCILTPHEGEAARLLNIPVAEISGNREKSAKTIAEEFSAVCVLKGAGTLVVSAKGELLQNTTGNPGMATGGSGDVLTGMAASFAAQFRKGDLQENFNAALAAVYLHGLAGDLAAREMGEYGLIAGDIPCYIPYAIKELSKKSNRNPVSS